MRLTYLFVSYMILPGYCFPVFMTNSTLNIPENEENGDETFFLARITVLETYNVCLDLFYSIQMGNT